MIKPRSPSRKLYRRRQSCPGNYDDSEDDDDDDDDDENDHINDFYNNYHYLFLSS